MCNPTRSLWQAVEIGESNKEIDLIHPHYMREIETGERNGVPLQTVLSFVKRARGGVTTLAFRSTVAETPKSLEDITLHTPRLTLLTLWGGNDWPTFSEEQLSGDAFRFNDKLRANFFVPAAVVHSIFRNCPNLEHFDAGLVCTHHTRVVEWVQPAPGTLGPIAPSLRTFSFIIAAARSTAFFQLVCTWFSPCPHC